MLPGCSDCALPSECAGLPQVVLEEGERRIPVTIRGLSPNGYLLVRRLTTCFCCLLCRSFMATA